MPNPIPALIEALGAHLDGWQPADFDELLAFTDGLPAFLDKVYETMKDAFADLAENERISDGTTDASDEMLVILGSAEEAAEGVAAAFRKENEFWLRGRG